MSAKKEAAAAKTKTPTPKDDDEVDMTPIHEPHDHVRLYVFWLWRCYFSFYVWNDSL
jgi:hypothetical protein